MEINQCRMCIILGCKRRTVIRFASSHHDLLLIRLMGGLCTVVNPCPAHPPWSIGRVHQMSDCTEHPGHVFIFLRVFGARGSLRCQIERTFQTSFPASPSSMSYSAVHRVCSAMRCKNMRGYHFFLGEGGERSEVERMWCGQFLAAWWGTLCGTGCTAFIKSLAYTG